MDSSTETSVFSKSRSRLVNQAFIKQTFCERHARNTRTKCMVTRLFWVVFRGVSAYTVHWVSRAGLFQCQL